MWIETPLGLGLTGVKTDETEIVIGFVMIVAHVVGNAAAGGGVEWWLWWCCCCRRPRPQYGTSSSIDGERNDVVSCGNLKSSHVNYDDDDGDDDDDDEDV